MNDRGPTVGSVAVTLIIITIFLVAYVLAVNLSHAEPPPGAHAPVIGEWFRSLKVPETNGSCCDAADCRPVLTRIERGHLEAFIDKKSFGPQGTDTWVQVPDKVVLHQHDNPMGADIACFFMGEVRCFIQGTQI